MENINQVPTTSNNSRRVEVCPICGKVFNHKGHFNRHLKNVHKRAESAAAGPSRDAALPHAPSESSSAATHVCTICNKTFGQKCNLTRHLKIHTGVKDFTCGICSKSFTTNSNLSRHMECHKQNPATFDCPDCGKSFGRKYYMVAHRFTHLRPQRGGAKPINPPAPKRMRGAEVRTSDVFTTRHLFPSEEAIGDLLLFIRENHSKVNDVLVEGLEDKRAIKWYVVSKIRFTRKNAEGEDEFATPYFRSVVAIELDESNLQPHIDRAFEKIKTSFDEFIERGSAWIFDEIIHLEVKIATYQPLAPASYFDLPGKLKAKEAVVNINNRDNKCFIWCILAALHPVERSSQPHRVVHYQQFEEELKMGNVTCPVAPCKVRFIEALNNLRINVFGYEEDEVLPLYISKREDDRVINLLYISDGENQHYCLIKSMSRLLSHLTNHKATSFYCYSCLHRFSEERILKGHIPYCNEHSPQSIKMPTNKDCLLEFTQHKFSLKVPFVIYADFEALVEKLEVSASSSTVKTATHTPCGYAYVIIGPDGKPLKPVSIYRGPDAVDHFITNIIAEKDELAVKLTTIVPMKITAQDQLIINATTHCGLCKKPLGADRVRDHDHLTGQFRQVLHSECNLAFKMRKMIPCIFHNLKNYDAHLIMQGLGKLRDHEIGVIPTTMEKYISFSLTKKLGKIPITLQFVDSLQFLTTSLQKLVDNLEKDKFAILKSSIPSHHDLLLKKGIYPYEYMNAFSKFQETSLPPKDAFFSSLTDSEITEEDYLHAQNVWSTFNITDLGAYHDLYVKSDVLLLADVFENFRKLTMNFYKLDAAHMMTSPGLAWQAALKMTDVKLDLFTDVDMHLFIEKGIRGGVSVISHRHGQANHPGCPDYNPAEENRHILYLDANNLYGWAMSQPLPVGDFMWEDPENTPIHTILNQPDDADIGYILEVDLDYPKDLHDLHNLYPLAPERFSITPQMLSPTNKTILDQMNMKPSPSSQKLVPNLHPKLNYVIHYRNLKLYLKLGLKLTKIHRILQFTQQPWLKDYIHFNTEQRKQAKSSFEKDMFKLLNNAVFGKTMENLRNRVDVQLTNNPQKAKKLVASPAFHAFTEFSNELAAVQRKVKSLTLNRPIHVGFSILELSKVLMYQFHYEVILEKYGSNARLLFTDTDSLTYELTTPNLTRDLREMEKFFDFSDFTPTHPLYNITNKKKLGFFKDELNGKHGYEFVGLRSKMYSISSECEDKRTAKGITRAAQRQLKHQTYKDCLLNQQPTSVIQHRIGSEKHKVFSLQQTKRALSAFDDKRYLLDDGVSSYAYGHYKIP